MAKDFVVIALVTIDRGQYLGCRVVRETSPYPATYREVWGPSTFEDCLSWQTDNCQTIEAWWDEERDWAQKLEREWADGDADSCLAVQRVVELCHIDRPAEARIIWEGDRIRYPAPYSRTCKTVAFAEISGPGDLMESDWSDMARCAVEAARAASGSAGLMAVIASPAAALPEFKPAFLARLAPKIGARVTEIFAGLSVENVFGEWQKL